MFLLPKRYVVILLSSFLMMPGISLGVAQATSFDLAQGEPPQAIEPSEMTMTFEENFETLDVSPWGPGTRWIAHTPWAGDFGGAVFADPEEGFPFTIVDGVLRIEAAPDEKGRWRSGLLASVDKEGNGFSQQYGYFEMSARLPTQPGVWPAFWLIGKDRSKTTAEVDILEFYGSKPEGYTSVVHVWRRPDGNYSRGTRNNVFDSQSPADFHSYGAWIGEKWIGIYFDRKLVWKTETQAEHRQPMYLLLNLAMVEDGTLLSASRSSYMYVDYVRVFE